MNNESAPKPKRMNKMFVPIIFTVLILVIAGVGYEIANYIASSKYSSEEILRSIAENNSQTFFQSGLAGSQLSAADTSSKLLIDPSYREHDYNHSSFKLTAGPKYSVCGYDAYTPVSSYYNESFDYYDKVSGKFYTKYISYDENRAVYDYNLSRDDYRIDYKGGEYAVKLVGESNFRLYDALSSYAETDPVSYTEASDPEIPIEDEPIVEIPPSDDIDIKEYYGNDVKIVKREVIAGIDYYVVEWSTNDYFCNDGTVKLITRSWADASDFSITKTEQYINSISNSNLISKTEQQYDYSDGSFAQFSSFFDFDYNVTLKEVDATINNSSSEIYQEKFKEILNSRNISVIEPTDTSLQIEGISAYNMDLPDPYVYLQDRKFYRNDTVGDKFYSLNQSQPFGIPDESYTKLILTYSFSKSSEQTYKSLIINQYEQDINTNELIKNIGANDSSKTTFSIKIGSEDVLTTMYESGFYESDTKRCDECLPEFYILINYRNNVFAVNLYGFESSDEAKKALNFNAYSGSNSGELEHIIELLKKNTSLEVLK